MSSQATSLLGIDLNLTGNEDARTRIVKACARCWFDTNATHLHNYSDCSGFVKAVQSELHLRPFIGDANSIFGEVEERADWQILGSGSEALTIAGMSANQGSLTIGVWKNPAEGKNGHVAIICSYLSLLGAKPEQHAIGGWGQLHKVGRLFDKLSRSFGKDKLKHIRYAKCLVPVVF